VIALRREPAQHEEIELDAPVSELSPTWPQPDAGEQVRQAILQGMALEKRPASPAPSVTPAVPESQRKATAGSRFNVVLPLKDGRRLAYNTLSTAFAVWSPQEASVYERAAAGVCTTGDAEVGDFLAGGYVVPQDMNELDEYARKYYAVRFDSGSMTVTIAPTTSCNFACDYCFQGVDKPNTKMSKKVQDAFIAFLETRLPRLKSLSIAWFGGEPLMGLPTIRGLSRRMIALCRKYRVRYDAFIVTNGYFLTAKVARELVSLKVTGAQVTFDGPAEFHDKRRLLTSGRPTYDIIVDNLREVIDAVPLQISGRVNVDERNVGQVRQLIDDLASRGFAGRKTFGLYFAPVEAITDSCQSCSEVEIGKAAYGRLEAEFYRYAIDRGLCGLPKPPLFMGNCQAVRPNGLLLAPDGSIHKCWDTMHLSELKVGSIFEPEKFADNPIFKKWLAWTPLDNPVCRECKILPICSGMCAFKFVHAEQTHGEAGILPCPSWKFNFNERIFLRAEKMGVVRREDIADEVYATSAASVGANHNLNDFPVISGRTRPFPLPVTVEIAAVC
jgi:uncharacterized protein